MSISRQCWSRRQSLGSAYLGVNQSWDKSLTLAVAIEIARSHEATSKHEDANRRQQKPSRRQGVLMLFVRNRKRNSVTTAENNIRGGNAMPMVYSILSPLPQGSHEIACATSVPFTRDISLVVVFLSGERNNYIWKFLGGFFVFKSF